jgi:hypothetical protein
MATKFSEMAKVQMSYVEDALQGMEVAYAVDYTAGTFTINGETFTTQEELEQYLEVPQEAPLQYSMDDDKFEERTGELRTLFHEAIENIFRAQLLDNSNENVQAAIEELDDRLEDVGGGFYNMPAQAAIVVQLYNKEVTDWEVE